LSDVPLFSTIVDLAMPPLLYRVSRVLTEVQTNESSFLARNVVHVGKNSGQLFLGMPDVFHITWNENFTIPFAFRLKTKHI
jgi:hypothetical protein